MQVIKNVLKKVLKKLGYRIERNNAMGGFISYDYDGLRTIHDASFMDDPSFKTAYHYAKDKIGYDFYWYWRNYIGIKLAEHSLSISNNFVECGVGEGWMTLSILKYFNEKKDITINLFDTFSGLDEAIVDPKEEQYWGKNAKMKKEEYKSSYNCDENKIKERIIETIGSLNKVNIFKGSIPSTFSTKNIEKVLSNGEISFCHIDMNNSVPEIAAIQVFYPLLAKGGFILLDDYGYRGHTYQKEQIDSLCRKKGLNMPILLPTGQGIIVK